MHVMSYAAATPVTVSVSPSTFNETDAITITFSNVPDATFGASHQLYLWAWSLNASNVSADCPTNGTWSASNAANLLTYVSTSGGMSTYTFTISNVSTFYGRTGLSKIGFLIKDYSGTVQSQDTLLPVGKFQIYITNPNQNPIQYNMNQGVTIQTTSSVAAIFTMKITSANTGAVLNTYTSASGITTYNQFYVFKDDVIIEVTGTATDGSGATQTKTTQAFITPVVNSVAFDYTKYKEGINYDSADPTHVVLALYAPGKTFVHAIGSFNNWNVCKNYQLNKDTVDPNLWWIDVKGLTAQQLYTFQYRTNDKIKVADPYSRLVLSPDDDPWINYSATVYPNLPSYPSGQQYDVSVVQTGMPTYAWSSATTNFVKPAKEKLNVYELLVRDFTPEATWTSTIAKIPYLKNLGINAVELMPIMEFDGNNSWGYNPGFHYAIDKAYGTPEKFKEFVDTCHQNGIAVILDIALNHASGRSPIQRLWCNNTTDGGYGAVISTNPYFNVTATHAYSVLNDFNHSQAKTQYYVNRVLEQWIKEYKIDGFRWDLTKGFTQNCTPSDESCTGSYQQDRVDVLKKYADYQWSYDANTYIIFEHLGGDTEQQQWANYKTGIMPWANYNYAYNQNTMGYATGSDFGGVNFANHGYTTPRSMNYGESHDEERLNYKNKTSGLGGSTSANLERMKAFGAVFLTIPGPKMLWQFGELGYDLSINTCPNGTVSGCRTDPKPSAFGLNSNFSSSVFPGFPYSTDANRQAVYTTWAKILSLRNNNPVFTNTVATSNSTTGFSISSGDLLPRIYIWDNTIASSSLRNVVVFANFTTSTQTITPFFPYTGTWYNLMDNSTLAVNSTSQTYVLNPGEFRIFGNALPVVLGTEDIVRANETSLVLMQNPVLNGVAQIKYKNAKNGQLTILDLSGKIVRVQKINKDSGEEIISVSGLNKGLYIIQLKSEKGTSIAKMIVQ